MSLSNFLNRQPSNITSFDIGITAIEDVLIVQQTNGTSGQQIAATLYRTKLPGSRQVQWWLSIPTGNTLTMSTTASPLLLSLPVNNPALTPLAGYQQFNHICPAIIGGSSQPVRCVVQSGNFPPTNYIIGIGIDNGTGGIANITASATVQFGVNVLSGTYVASS